MDIHEMKARAYDLIVLRDQLASELAKLNVEIAQAMRKDKENGETNSNG